MRDILTVLSGLLILVLAALLAVPPLVDWTAHRDLVDSALSRAFGQPVRSAGALDIRLLPYPRVRIARLSVGRDDGEDATLDAMFVRAEIGLTPLLGGEVRFLETRIGRAEFKLPTGADGDWRVKRRLFAGVEQRRAWAFEDLSVQQFLVTTFDPPTGRTDQVYAENVRMQAPSLAGPWRLEGVTGRVPFELTLGELSPDASASLRLRAGGDGPTRFDVDGKLDLTPAPGDVLVPRLTGSARLAYLAPPRAGSPARPVIQAQAAIVAAGRDVALANLAIEAGEGITALRLAGSGSYRIDAPRLSLDLAGRRLDLAAFRAAAGRQVANALAAWRAGPAAVVTDVALRLDGLAVGGDEDLTAIVARATLDGESVRDARLDLLAPGRAAITAEGEFVLGPAPAGSGRIALEAEDGERLLRVLDGLGLRLGDPSLIGGRPVRAAADVALVDPVVSLRNIRASVGDASLSGTLRYTAPEAGARARFEGQLALSGLDVATLPVGALLAGAARDVDVEITLDARDVVYGASKSGRIAGRLATEGSAVVVEGLEVSGLAGAEARLSGRIAPDGSGRIEGRLKADRAAPLVDLFGRAWLGGLVRLVPRAAREGAVDISLSAERVTPAGAAEPGLRTRLDGRLANGTFAAETLSSQGRVRRIVVQARTADESAWLGRKGPAGAPRPATIDLDGRRDERGRLAIGVTADLAGLRVATSEPLKLGPDDDRIEAGAGEVVSQDVSRGLALVGLPGAGAGPLSLKVGLAAAGSHLTLTGRIAGEDFWADLADPLAGEFSGRVKVSRLSLPWLVSSLALNLPEAGPAQGGAIVSGTRFGAPPDLPVRGAVDVEVATLDGLGRFAARDARFRLATRPDGIALTGLDAALGGGRLRGGFTLGRQGGLATLIGDLAAESVALPQLLGPPFGAGRLAAALRFGASGESPAGLLGNLGGAGEIALDGLRLNGADPDGVARSAARLLRTDDPLAVARYGPLLAEELGRAPFGPDPVRANASILGGAIRITPLALRSAAGSWQGSAVIDLRTATLEARGTLQSAAPPPRWIGASPTIGLGWTGPLAGPARTIDPAPLATGLATVVLARELERIEVFELDAAERQRRNSRLEMDRQRRLWAEERARQEQERQRREEERQRREERRARLEAERRRQEEGLPPRPPADLRAPSEAVGRD